jgi:hypothetical protein
MPTSSFHPQPLLRSLVALAAVLALGYAAYDAARRGLADWISMRARHDVATWAEKRAGLEREPWSRAMDALRAAARLMPDDPTLQEHLGVGYDLGQGMFDPNRTVNAYTQVAQRHFSEAVRLRPTSPLSWANLALTEYQLKRDDPELLQALDRAMALGPWEPSVQLITSELGLLLWDRLEPPLQARVRENWARTAFRQPDQLARLAATHKLVTLLCAQSVDTMKNRLKCPA